MKPELMRIKIAEACGLTCSACNGTGIHRKMGVDEYHSVRNSNDVWRRTWPIDEPDRKCSHEGFPNWLADLNAAVTLCDKLAEEIWTCEISQGLDRTWECSFQHPATQHTRPENRAGRHWEKHYHPADTLAEAICGAFLKVKGLWEDEKEGVS